MAVKLNIEYDQLLELVRQLPLKERKKLIKDLEEKPVNGTASINTQNGQEPTDFQKFLLQFNDFVATEEDLKGYKEAEKKVNEMFKK